MDQRIDASKTGYGLEAEAMILDRDEHALVRIGEQPAVEALIQSFRARWPKDGEHLSPEQLGHMIEFASGVHDEPEGAIEEVVNLRDGAQAILDQLMPDSGARIRFQPVVKYPFEVVLSSSDPDSRLAHLCTDPWWAANISRTSLAGMQLNDSTLMRGCETRDAQLRRFMDIMNSHTPEVVRDMTDDDARMRDAEGRTRLELLASLIPSPQKWKAFEARGFTERGHVLFPPQFQDQAEMERWILAHANQDDLAQVQWKDVHGGIAKPKLHGPLGIVENRVRGSWGQSARDIRAHLAPVIRHHYELRERFAV